ncbi:MAG: MerR family transcriptional regulator [Paenibacillus sp.]|uniref:MerR family transcriptional regulator n=1 Tax=Paenibacillus sp. TaxID=58172 RepID=UPI0025D7FD9A|nr:MerR family transcriptional regulator [Paenibacillus sp.]MBR2563725.1 MerR family transcriptional regulator [Paenibacillus sp.]
MTRGQLAKKTGVSMATLRYYEDSGILPAPHRSSNGYRMYTEDYLVKVKFIKDAQMLGYSLKAIQETLDLLSNEEMEKDTLKSLVRERITDIQQHIDQLEQMQKHLAGLLLIPEDEIDSYIQSFRVEKKEP